MLKVKIKTVNSFVLIHVRFHCKNFACWSFTISDCEPTIPTSNGVEGLHQTADMKGRWISVLQKVNCWYHLAQSLATVLETHQQAGEAPTQSLGKTCVLKHSMSFLLPPVGRREGDNALWRRPVAPGWTLKHRHHLIGWPCPGASGNCAEGYCNQATRAWLLLQGLEPHDRQLIEKNKEPWVWPIANGTIISLPKNRSHPFRVVGFYPEI